MKYKILQLDANGRISFSKEELENLLDEVYSNGYDDGRKTCQYPYWTYPTTPTWKTDKIWVDTGTPYTDSATTVCTGGATSGTSTSTSYAENSHIKVTGNTCPSHLVRNCG